MTGSALQQLAQNQSTGGSISSDDYQPPAGQGGENTFLDQKIRAMTAMANQAAPLTQAKLPLPTDNINGYPEMSDFHKYSLLIAHYLNGDIPNSEFSVDSPTMKNIIDQYQQSAMSNQTLLRMQSVQPNAPAYQKATIQGEDI